MSMIPIMGFHAAVTTNRIASSRVPPSNAKIRKDNKAEQDKKVASLIEQKNQLLVNIGEMLEKLKLIEKELQELSK